MATVAKHTCVDCGSPIGNRFRGCLSCRTAPRFRRSTAVLAAATIGAGVLALAGTADSSGRAAPAVAAAAR
jgi:hypothetical protein